MKQLTYIKPKKLLWQEVTEPTIENDTDALVRPFLVARCDLDAAFLHQNIFKKYRIGKFLGLVDKTIPEFTRENVLKGPFPFGHECVAEVLALGKSVPHLSIGQKVIVPFQISCGECPICSSGLTSQCVTTGSFNMFSGIGNHVVNGGTMSEVLRVPYAHQMLIPIGEDTDPIGLASASDNLPDAWSRIAPFLLNNTNKKVLIIGGGAKSVGLYAAAFASKMNTEVVDYVDKSEERINIAKKVGANGIRGDYRQHDGRYDLVVNCTNALDAIKLGIKWLNPGGVLSSANIYFNKNVRVPFFQLYAKNIRLVTGLANPLADIPEMLAFIKEKDIRPELITTHIGKWESASEDLLRKTTKVIIQRNPILSNN